MKAKHYRWVFIGYIVLLLIAMALHSNETIGLSAESSNGNYFYQTGCAPWSLTFAIVGAGLYFLLFSSETAFCSKKMPFLFRRWLAGVTDFILALFTPGAFIGLVGILIEYRRTGAFEWLIERQEELSGDWIFATISTLILMFVIMPCYFALSWRFGKPTPGACIFGFRIVADAGTSLGISRAYLRALLGSLALLAWPCWILAYQVQRRKSAGKFWLDVIFRTHAESLD